MGHLFMPFLLTNISKFYQFHIIFAKNIESFQNQPKNTIEKLKTQEKPKTKKNPKTQAKNSKLKQKTQGPGGTCLFPLPKWC